MAMSLSTMKRTKKQSGKKKTLSGKKEKSKKTSLKEKCFDCQEDDHLRRNCPSSSKIRRRKRHKRLHSLKVLSSYKELDKDVFKIGIEDGSLVFVRVVEVPRPVFNLKKFL